LKEILLELGMDGKLSLEKAKKIRAKRELAEELEAVKEFDGKINRNKTRSSRAKVEKRNKAELDTDSEDEDNGAHNAQHKTSTKVRDLFGPLKRQLTLKRMPLRVSMLSWAIKATRTELLTPQCMFGWYNYW
jgi:hypothetical protein